MENKIDHSQKSKCDLCPRGRKGVLDVNHCETGSRRQAAAEQGEFRFHCVLGSH